jgi:hypothetical protein
MDLHVIVSDDPDRPPRVTWYLDHMTDETEGQPADMTSVIAEDGREIRFHGDRLGYASSHWAGKNRWIEMSIYKTRGGKYVIAGVGCTNVPGEVQRNWAHVCEDPEGAIESLYLYDEDGVRYMTRTAREALTQACAQDPALRDAYMVETID